MIESWWNAIEWAPVLYVLVMIGLSLVCAGFTYALIRAQVGSYSALREKYKKQHEDEAEDNGSEDPKATSNNPEETPAVEEDLQKTAEQLSKVAREVKEAQSETQEAAQRFAQAVRSSGSASVTALSNEIQKLRKETKTQSRRLQQFQFLLLYNKTLDVENFMDLTLGSEKTSLKEALNPLHHFSDIESMTTWYYIDYKKDLIMPTYGEFQQMLQKTLQPGVKKLFEDPQG